MSWIVCQGSVLRTDTVRLSITGSQCPIGAVPRKDFAVALYCSTAGLSRHINAAPACSRAVGSNASSTNTRLKHSLPLCVACRADAGWRSRANEHGDLGCRIAPGRCGTHRCYNGRRYCGCCRCCFRFEGSPLITPGPQAGAVAAGACGSPGLCQMLLDNHGTLAQVTTNSGALAGRAGLGSLSGSAGDASPGGGRC
jgi:hypothetical protein